MSKNNEIMEPEVIENDIDVLEPEVYDETEESGISLGKLALGVGLVAGGIGILCYKFKDKFEEHQVKKLKKKGYVVIKPEDEDEDDVFEDKDDDFDIEDIEETSEEEK